MSAAERHALLHEWNDTAGAVPPGTVHGRFAQQAASTPGRPALAAPGYRSSYAELAACVERLAGVLRAAGARAGGAAAICLERSPQLVAALLATLESGAACVPLDPAWPAERLSLVMADSGAEILITEDRFAALPAAAGVRRVLLDGVEARLGGHPAPAGAPAAAAVPAGASGAVAGPDDLAYVLYSPASTGSQPPGVMLTHRAIAGRLRWMQRAFALASEDRVLHRTEVGRAAAIWEIFLPLWCGAQLVLAEPGAEHGSADLARHVMELGITVLQLAPAQLQRFVEEPASVRCRGLRRVLCAGGPLPEALRERFFARLGGAELDQLYGPDEAASAASCCRYRRRDAAGPVPIGRPVDDVSLHVLDSRLELAPLGMPGELAIGGDGLAVGYRGGAGLTAERFLPDPWAAAPGGRLYRSGDLARRRPDGVLDLLAESDRRASGRPDRRRPPGPPAPPAPRAPAAAGAAAPRSYTAPRDAIERALAEIWAQVLRAERVGIDDNFFALGGNADLYLEVVSRAGERGWRLPPGLISERQTIRALARKALPAAAPPPS
jgi:amino acid adenylation domain-containing protein